MTETKGHPSLETLIAFQDPALDDKRRAPIQDHLAGCQNCRERLISLLSLRSSMAAPSQMEPMLQTGPNCVPMELLADFMGGRLEDKEWEIYSAHTEDCDVCFERAAFFSQSSSRMAEGVLRIEKTPERFLKAVAPGINLVPPVEKVQKLGESLTTRILRWISSPIPAYAFAATLLGFIAFGDRGVSILELSGPQAFSIYEQPSSPGPSFGFSDAGRKVGEEDAGLDVKLSGGDIEFLWIPMEGASEYRLIVNELGVAGIQEVVNVITAEPRVVVDAGSFSPRKAYQWSVNGVRPDNMIFTASGQFVLSGH